MQFVSTVILDFFKFVCTFLICGFNFQILLFGDFINLLSRLLVIALNQSFALDPHLFHLTIAFSSDASYLLILLFCQLSNQSVSLLAKSLHLGLVLRLQCVDLSLVLLIADLNNVVVLLRQRICTELVSLKHVLQPSKVLLLFLSCMCFHLLHLNTEELVVLNKLLLIAKVCLRDLFDL